MNLDGIKILICGGRDYNNEESMDFVIRNFCVKELTIKTLIHGGAVGADLLAAHSVEKYNKELQESFDIDKMITIEEFPANWKKYGKSAGIIRNIDMLQNGDPDIVIGFPGGRGTAHMLDISQKADKAVFQVLDGPKGIEIINKKTGKKVEF